MSSSDNRKGLDWSLIIAATVGSVIALVAAFASGYWKAHTNAQATKSAQSRLVRGSVRAWRDDLYDAGVESLKAVLISLERARLKLARELDDGEPGPAPHPIFHEAGLKYPRGQVEIR